MRYGFLIILTVFLCLPGLMAAQSGKFVRYSESTSQTQHIQPPENESQSSDDETIRVETVLVTVPVRVTSKDSRPVTDIRQEEFRIFENGEERQIAYFSSIDQPFTVALLLDTSYSTVFKLKEIQAAALLFISNLKPTDKVTVIAFDERPRVLCQPTSNRKALRLAIEAIRTGSGTSLYDSLDLAINKQLANIQGRKAVVLLTDGVDTFSVRSSKKAVLRQIREEDVIVYTLRYDTYDDVRKNRRKDAEIRYDENDRPYIYERPPGKGEREIDYLAAKEFLDVISDHTGGRVFKVSSATNLKTAFAKIAEELRKTYSLGYYPLGKREPGTLFTIKIRIYRPNLNIRTREVFIERQE